MPQGFEQSDDLVRPYSVEDQLSLLSLTSDNAVDFFKNLGSPAGGAIPPEFPVFTINAGELPSESSQPKENDKGVKKDNGVTETGKWTESGDGTGTFKAEDGTVWNTTFDKTGDSFDLKTPDGTTYHVDANNELTITDARGNRSTYKGSVMQFRGSGQSITYPPEAQFTLYRGNGKTTLDSAVFASGGELKKIESHLNAEQVKYSTLGKADAGKLAHEGDGTQSFSAKDGTKFVKAKDGSMKLKFAEGTIEIDATQSNFTFTDNNGKTTKGKIDDGEFSVAKMDFELGKEKDWSQLKIISHSEKPAPLYSFTFNDTSFTYKKYADKYNVPFGG